MLEGLNADGQRVEVVCVKSAAHPDSGPGDLAGKLSRWRDGYGAVFGVMVQVLSDAGGIAVQVL